MGKCCGIRGDVPNNIRRSKDIPSVDVQGPFPPLVLGLNSFWALFDCPRNRPQCGCGWLASGFDSKARMANLIGTIQGRVQVDLAARAHRNLSLPGAESCLQDFYIVVASSQPNDRRSA